MNTIPDLVFSACKKFNFKPAIEEDSKTFSFKDVYEQSMKIANFLIKNNLKKGDRVAICMNKSIFQVLSMTHQLLSSQQNASLNQIYLD